MTWHCVGIDFSLTNSGVAVMRGDRERPLLRNVLSGPSKSGDRDGKPYATLLDRRNRHRAIASRIVEYALDGFNRDTDLGLAVIEAPFYAASGSSGTAGQHDRAWAWGLIVDALFARGLVVVEVGNSALKKYATGDGHASKETMLAVMPRLFPGVFIDDHNIADAAAALGMGCRALGHPVEPSPNRVTPSAMLKVDWPRNLREEYHA
jgi:Holliday junction resolvasome RuvABC endonuclease subunit